MVRVPEVKRRQNHVDPNHPLLPIILDSLRDEDKERPSASQLCERVAYLKEVPEYRDRDSVQAVLQDKKKTIWNKALKAKDGSTTATRKENSKQVSQKLHKRDRQLKLQQEADKHVIAQFARRSAEHKPLQRLQLSQNPETTTTGKDLACTKLRWRQGKRTPFVMFRQSDAVVDGSTVYVRKYDSWKIYAYDAGNSFWSQLPNCINWNCSVAIVNGWLTTVGGFSIYEYSNELFNLNGKISGRSWIKKFPPMPTKRSMTTVLHVQTMLIVAGGKGVGGVLSTVEVMNTENHQWSTAADLPEPTDCASAADCRDHIYILGGTQYHSTSYSCSVSTLLQACKLGGHTGKMSLVYSARTWLYTIGGLDRWTGLVDWTTGLTFLPRKSTKCNIFDSSVIHSL